MPIEIFNDTGEIVRVALFRRSPLRPGEPAVAWTVVSPPPGGKAALPLPRAYRVFVRYSLAPEDVSQPVNETSPAVVRQGEGWTVEGERLDRATWTAVLVRTPSRSPWEPLRLVNRSGLGVWAHVQWGERDLYPSRVLPPLAVLLEDLRSPLCLAVVGPPLEAGDRIDDMAIRQPTLEVVDGARVLVRDHRLQGPVLSLAPPHQAQPRKTVAVAPSPGRRKETPAKPKKPARSRKKPVAGREGAPAEKPPKSLKPKKPRESKPKEPSPLPKQARSKGKGSAAAETAS